MSHYTVMVVLPPRVDVKTPAGADLVERVLACFCEQDYYDKKDGVIAAKWDWYVVGGRWEEYFSFVSGASERVVNPRANGRCDGGRLRDLDLKKLRTEAAEKAEREWNEYAMVISGTPEPIRWAQFIERHDREEMAALSGMSRWATIEQLSTTTRVEMGLPATDEDFWEWVSERLEGEEVDEDSETYLADRNLYDEYTGRREGIISEVDAKLASAAVFTIDQARAAYGAQPRVQAVRTSPMFRARFFDDPISDIDPYTRDEYVALKVAQAVPAFATLRVEMSDLDPEGFTPIWMERGSMGWFGMSSATEVSTELYCEKVNELLDEADPETTVVLYDFHI